MKPSLEVWMEELRSPLQRGGLAARGPITLRDGSQLPDTELAARIMLADLAHLDALLPARYPDPPDRQIARRRRSLLADFQHLRAQLAS